MDVSTKQKQIHRRREQTHRHREQTCGCWDGGWGAGMDWEFGISRCKLLYTEWITTRSHYNAQGNLFNTL